MSAEYVASIIFNGLTSGAVYAILALGLTIIFGILNVVNFAHGQLMMTAAYVMVSIVSAHFSYWLALVAVVIGAAVGGTALDMSLFARVRRNPVSGLLISVGLIAILGNIQLQVWGASEYQLQGPVSGTFNIGSLTLSLPGLVVIVATVVCVVLLTWLLRYTEIGRCLRATGQNPEAAALMGIPVERIRHVAFALGTVLAAVAGALIALLLPIAPVLQSSLLITGFIALILGGAGSPMGAVLGGIILGMIQSIGITVFSSEVADIASYVALIVILFLRPGGIVSSHQEATL
jgi:branched-chain amino acid transport system permease protein